MSTKATSHNKNSNVIELREDLFCLGYISRSLIDPEPKVLSPTLEDIVAGAKAANRERGITGKLLYGRGFFLQVIEGMADDIEALFDLIQQDRRHSDIKLLYHEAISRRVFSDCSMTLEIMRDDESERLPELHGLPGHFRSTIEDQLSLLSFTGAGANPEAQSDTLAG